MLEGAADREDDTEGHRGGKDRGHGCDDGLNGVSGICRFDDEPEEHVDHIDSPDGLEREGLDTFYLDKAKLTP